jgi:antitoxin component of RelBE/YafQ-DinJ toxin-antitoxin module
MEGAMNLTLSIDKRLLEKARVTAGAMGLSLNEMIRRYLEKVAGA